MIITKTDRLTLRYVTLEDLNALAPIFADPEVMKFSITGKPRSEAKTKQWIEDRLDEYERVGFSFYAVIHNEDECLIGYCGLAPVDIDGQTEIEIGYRFAHAYWNQGLGTEAAMACKEYGFKTLAINRLIAITEAPNTASINITRKLDMRYEKDTLYQGKSPVRIYSINKF